MIVLPQINPEAFRIGPIAVYWYGLMYGVGFAAALVLGNVRLRRNGMLLRSDRFRDLMFFTMVGLIVGARLGYMLFYTNFSFFKHPWEIIEVWKGGMSFHGGLIGVAIAILIFSRRHDLHLLDVADFVAPLAPPGLLAGRTGNFINSELWGRPSDLPWAMVFPDPAAGYLPRHPSPLYEALLEGVVLFGVLWLFSEKSRPRGAVAGLFLLLYGTFRFLVEFTRQPDAQMGFIFFNWVTMGQMLSLPMAAAGAWFLICSKGFEKKGEKRGCFFG